MFVAKINGTLCFCTAVSQLILKDLQETSFLFTEFDSIAQYYSKIYQFYIQ